MRTISSSRISETGTRLRSMRLSKRTTPSISSSRKAVTRNKFVNSEEMSMKPRDEFLNRAKN
jgi:hypothetical protein